MVLEVNIVFVVFVILMVRVVVVMSGCGVIVVVFEIVLHGTVTVDGVMIVDPVLVDTEVVASHESNRLPNRKSSPLTYLQHPG